MGLELLDSITDELEDYDNIDCVGVVFEAGEVKETKIYHYEKREKKKTTIENYAVVENTTDLRRYYRIIPNDKVDYLSAVNEFINKENLSDDIGRIILKICAISSKEKNAMRIRLSQVGIQNGCKHEKILKSYFSTRKFVSCSDVRGIKQKFKEIKDIFVEIKENCLLSDEYYDFLDKNANIFENYGYYASLIGINQKKEELEFKVYFELFSPDNYFERIKEHTTELINYICSKYRIPEDELNKVNVDFIKRGYFLRGFAISNNYGKDDEVLLRLYFAPIQRFL